MSKEAWGDEGNVGDFTTTQIYHDLCDVQRRLYKFHQDNKEDFPNDEFGDFFDAADVAIQEMFGQLED